MNTPAEMLRELSEPWPSGEKVKVAIDRAARLAGLDYWRAFDLWYHKARRVDISEHQQIAKALQEKHERDARNELHALKTRLATLEARLDAGDADFHSPALAAHREYMRELGNVDRPMVKRRGCVTS